MVAESVAEEGTAPGNSGASLVSVLVQFAATWRKSPFSQSA
jgi:hypothetical protein